MVPAFPALLLQPWRGWENGMKGAGDPVRRGGNREMETPGLEKLPSLKDPTPKSEKLKWDKAP